MVEQYETIEGILTEVPIFESHTRGKNWMAVISSDSDSPGGLARNFARKVISGGYYHTSGLVNLYDPIEFGADYYTTSHNAHRSRWYGVVVEIAEDYIALQKVSSGTAAIKRSGELKAAAMKEKNIEVTEENQQQKLDIKNIETEALIAELKNRGVLGMFSKASNE